MFLNLKDLTYQNRIEFGAKAAALGELIRNGFNVPEGFAISFQTFEQFLAFNNFAYTPTDYLSFNWEIQALIASGSFLPEMETELEKYLAKLLTGEPNEIFVVRSSAWGEDSAEYSMAGMFETFLDNKTIAELKFSIKQCYASLFADRVLNYLVENNLDFSTLKMAVIVQRFVPGDLSGVGFTVDAINMEPEVLCLNTVNGNCAGLVSGAAVSSLYRLRKNNGELVDSTEPGDAPKLTDLELKPLLQTLLSIEKVFGKPQDIEWTNSYGKIYILQSRPITTFREKEFPLQWSQPGDQDYLWKIGPNKPFPPLVQDIVLLRLAISNLGAYEAGYENGYKDIIFQNGYYYWRRREFPNLEEQQQQILTKIENLGRQGKNLFIDIMLPRLLEKINFLNNFIGRDLSNWEALKFLELSLEYNDIAKHWLAISGRKYRQIFADYCQENYGEISITDLYDLIYQPSYLTKERERGLQMAAVVKANRKLDQLFAICTYDPIVYARLLKMPEAKDLLKLINEHIRELGSCDTPIDTFLRPAVSERPDYVLAMIRSLLDIDANVFNQSFQKIFENKQRLVKRILEKIGPEKELEFFKKLHLAEKAFLTGDDHHFYIERRCIGYLRLAAIGAARVLNKAGSLDDVEDIHFMTLAEIKDALQQSSSYQEIIKERKALFEQQKKLFAPPSIGREPEKSGLVDSVELDNTNVLNGVAGLCKVVTGVIQLGIPKQLSEEKILVLNDGHAEFLHLLKHIKGLIFEKGSPFDHAGIIARELDIPALYYVKNAKKLLHDGDLVELDGLNRRVVVIQKPKQAVVS